MGSFGTRNKEQQEAQRLYDEMVALDGPIKFQVQYQAKKAALEAYKKANEEALEEVPGKPAKVEVVEIEEPVLPVELEEPPVVKLKGEKKKKALEDYTEDDFKEETEAE
jgi:hypothetical protein